VGNWVYFSDDDFLLLPKSLNYFIFVPVRLFVSRWLHGNLRCVPAGVLPLVTTPTGMGGSLKFQPASEFEDISQMLEWLILIESKLQPVVITVGDFVHLKKLLRDLQGIEKELNSRERDYKRFMSGLDPTDDFRSVLGSSQERSLNSTNTSIVEPTNMSTSTPKSVSSVTKIPWREEFATRRFGTKSKPAGADLNQQNPVWSSRMLAQPTLTPFCTIPLVQLPPPR